MARPGRSPQCAATVPAPTGTSAAAGGPALPGGGGLRRPGKPDRLTPAELLRERWSNIDARQMCDGDPDIQDRDAWILESPKCLDADRVLDREWPLPSPAEPAKQPAGLERLTQVGGEHPHVCALPRRDEHLGFGDGAGPEVNQFDGIDRRGSRQPLHLLARTRQLVQVASLVTHRGMHGW